MAGPESLEERRSFSFWRKSEVRLECLNLILKVFNGSSIRRVQALHYGDVLEVERVFSLSTSIQYYADLIVVIGDNLGLHEAQRCPQNGVDTTCRLTFFLDQGLTIMNVLLIHGLVTVD